MRGVSDRPLTPVLARVQLGADGTLALRWTRRARGGWHWLDGVDVPLVEESERYEVGCGAISNPLALYQTGEPSFHLDSAMLAALPAGTSIWIRQIGSYARSPALLLATLP